jgi:hypothetical protein
MFPVKNADFFAKFFGENTLKIITSVLPWWRGLHSGIVSPATEETGVMGREIESRQGTGDRSSCIQT